MRRHTRIVAGIYLYISVSSGGIVRGTHWSQDLRLEKPSTTKFRDQSLERTYTCWSARGFPDMFQLVLNQTQDLIENIHEYGVEFVSNH
jgi:hypothetical protein